MDAAPVPVARPADDTAWLVLRWSVVALAALSRLWWLDGRPPHFDEGVNGWFTDQMRHLYCYEYDPNNYHGPLHFYVLFLFKGLLGRNLWALRLPTAFVGILTVEWCFRFERFFGRRTSAWAAVAMLVSPATMYFQRDAIHEAWLLFFLVLGFWGVCGLCQEGAKRHLWAAGMALAGMALTKETWIIHVGCLGLAAVGVFAAELFQPSRRALLRPEEAPPHAPPPPDADPAAPRPGWVTLPEERGLLASLRIALPPQRWSWPDLLAVAGTIAALIVFFYSGNFLLFDPGNYSQIKLDEQHPNALTWFHNIFAAYTPWGHKADDGEGHAKPFLTWCQLIVRNEPWALLGLLAAAAYAVPGLPRSRVRARGVALAAAAFCLAGVVIANGWDPVPWNTVKQTAVLREDHLQWWAMGVCIALAGAVCMARPPSSERELRACGAVALVGGIVVLCSPRVYPEPHLFTFVFVALAAATAALALPAPGDWRVRWLAIYGIGTLWAYSIIRYKTPWCIISLLWPFFFTGGAALSDLAAVGLGVGREAATGLGTAAAAIAASFAFDLNFLRPTDENFHQRPGENLGYVYVQSFDDVWTVTNYLLDEAKADPSFKARDGVILCDSTYPLPWLLGDFEHIGYYSGTNAPPSPDGYRVDFLLVTDKRVAEAESKLNDDYYKQPIRLRPALEGLQLYLRASRFAHLMPADREPEFHPVPEAPAVPADKETPAAPPPDKKDEG
ncbi:MAG: glycosyltransferase family 39 protein [Gluconacetobacter diazotrophicus]|nr:glycosyltransferase family 39 protein [Gluconacetobacter diazotrophicus]